MVDWLRSGAWCWALAGLAGAAAASGAGGAPASRFLEALRERGYYAEALDYLARMETSRLAPPEFRETILLERAETLIAAANGPQSEAVRRRRLDEAQAALEQFIAQRPDHPAAGTARRRLADLLIARARADLRQAAPPDAARLAEAGKLLDRAHAVLLEAKQRVRRQLEAMPETIPPFETEQLERLRRLRAEYVQLQLLAAAVVESQADAAPADSPERRDLLLQAATQYGEIYAKYAAYQAGLLALIYQGQAYAKAGRTTEAIGCYEEALAAAGSAAELRGLKAKAMRLLVRALAQQGQYADAVERGRPLLDAARPHEQSQPEWLGLRLELAACYAALADSLAKKAPRDRQVRNARREAAKLAQFVAERPGPEQQEAVLLAAQLGARPGGPADEPDETAPPGSFAEAKNQARQALEAMQMAQLVATMVRPRIAQEEDPQEQARLKQQVAEATQRAEASRARAMNLLRLALELADADTPTAELNDARYYLAYLFYAQGRYYEAAVLGEAVARRWPNDPRALACANIAHAAYAALYQQAPENDRRMESERLAGAAEWILQRWPESAEAEQAVRTLIPLMIDSGRLDQAERLLSRIPADSPQRAQAELQTGKALWSAYLRGREALRRREQAAEDAQEGPPSEQAPTPEALAELERRAETILADGVRRLRRSGQPSQELIESVLALAQVYADSGRSGEAIELLEDERIGPVRLADQQHPAAADPTLRREIYKTALRAYISGLSSADDPRALMDKAQRAMAGLGAVGDASPESRRRLLAVYYQLAMELKRQLELARTPAARESLAQGFEQFLDQVGRGADQLNVAYWVAETFAGMGDQAPREQGELSEAAKRFYAKALETYQRILQRGETQPDWLPEGVRDQVRLRSAAMLRQLGRPREALSQLVGVLSDHAALLPAQLEAARTLQSWAANGDPKRFLQAIRGAAFSAGGREVNVWGWGKIAQLTAGRNEHLEAFHEARYNLAVCRYGYAMRQTDEAERRRWLELAKKDIEVTCLLFKDLGGPEWERKYDVVLRAVQRQLGEPAVGLKAVRPPAGAGAG